MTGAVPGCPNSRIFASCRGTISAVLLVAAVGCTPGLQGGPPGQRVSSSPEGYRLVLEPEPAQGAAPLQVRLHTRLLGGPDFTDAQFCPMFMWQLGDGSLATITASCPGPPPDAPQGPVRLQRTMHTDNTYASPGAYRVRAFMQLGRNPNELWLVSEPVVITVR